VREGVEVLVAVTSRTSRDPSATLQVRGHQTDLIEASGITATAVMSPSSYGGSSGPDWLFHAGEKSDVQPWRSPAIQKKIPRRKPED